jgi:adenylate cyclase
MDPADMLFGPFRLDVKRKLLFRASEQVPLGQRGFALLQALARADGGPVSKAELMDAAWPGQAVEESNLNVQIAALRKALAKDGETADCILTVPRHGYRFNIKSSAKAQDEAPVREERPAIAVLPFDDQSQGHEHSYIADGICEDITTELGKFRHFIVIANSTMRGHKSLHVDLRELGAELGVRYFLTGSMRVQGQALRLSTQLLDARTGEHLWGTRFDRATDDVFAIQDEVATSVIRQLGSELLAAEHQRALRIQPASLNAWECFVRALASSAQLSNEGSKEALVLLERANSFDKSYARALGLQAWTTLWRAAQGWEDVPLALTKSEDLVRRAMLADEREPWAWVGRGTYLLVARHFGEAVKAMAKAVELNANFAMGWGMLGLANALAGNPDMALVALGNANRLSPHEVFVGAIAQQYAFAYFQARQYEESLQHAEWAHDLRPGHVYPLIVGASCAGLLGQREKATAFCKVLLSVSPEMSTSRMRSHAPFASQQDRDRLAEGLMAAGLP